VELGPVVAVAAGHGQAEDVAVERHRAIHVAGPVVDVVEPLHDHGRSLERSGAAQYSASRPRRSPRPRRDSEFWHGRMYGAMVRLACSPSPTCPSPNAWPNSCVATAWMSQATTHPDATLVIHR